MRHILLAASVLGGFALVGSTQEPGSSPPYQVKILDEKPVVVEAVMPVDPVQRIHVQSQGNMMVSMMHDNRILQLGAIQTTFKIDGQATNPGAAPGRMTVVNGPLPKTRDDKQRKGWRSVYENGKITITQEIEVVPTKSKAGEKRKLDSALVRYFIENKDTVSHNVGLRIFMDVYIIDNDGALFAAPNHPDKILDGVELKGDKVPDYIQFLQRPDLKNPGFVAHMTCKLGTGWDMPDRAVLSSLRAARDQWNLGVMQAGGDSAMAVFWEEKEVKAGTTRKVAYGYGQGIVPPADGDGLVAVSLAGSFEPDKLFTVSAQVQDPSAGQALSLELPSGMELVEGKQRQAVPEVDATGNSLVMWKARVLRTGQFNLRVHSSNGITATKIITISRPGENK